MTENSPAIYKKWQIAGLIVRENRWNLIDLTVFSAGTHQKEKDYQLTINIEMKRFRCDRALYIPLQHMIVVIENKYH